MMKSKERRKGIVLAAVLLLFLAAVRPGVAYGAPGIEAEEPCSITFGLDSTYEELAAIEIPVQLYRVAEVRTDSTYQVLPSYERLSERLLSIDASTTAEIWADIAQEAAQMVQDGAQEPDKILMLTDAKGSAEDLPTGLYLVEAQPVESAEYLYTFTPYLLQLPGNTYQESGEDTWDYAVEAGLKPEQNARTGRLRIDKTLTSYNATFGGASFIFQVEAVKDNALIYSDVVSLVFEETGTKGLLLEKEFPAGTTVTVTEVYSGAGYQASAGSSLVQSVQITAMQTAAVSFQNEYSGRLSGGSSVVNHFLYEETVTEDGEAAGGTWDVRQEASSEAEGV